MANVKIVTGDATEPLGPNEIEVTLTMRGDVQKVMGAIINGLPREALEKIHVAMNEKLAEHAVADIVAGEARDAANHD